MLDHPHEPAGVALGQGRTAAGDVDDEAPVLGTDGEHVTVRSGGDEVAPGAALNALREGGFEAVGPTLRTGGRRARIVLICHVRVPSVVAGPRGVCRTAGATAFCLYDEYTTTLAGCQHRAYTGAVEAVGTKEIAERFGVTREAVNKWRVRGIGFPESRWTVGGDPAWEWTEVESWGRQTGRLPSDGS